MKSNALSLVEQVQSICSTKNWTCLTPIREGFGVWGLLQWLCDRGHTIDASVHTAKLMVECPKCHAISKAKKETATLENVSVWEPVIDAHPVPPVTSEISQQGVGGQGGIMARLRKKGRDFDQGDTKTSLVDLLSIGGFFPLKYIIDRIPLPERRLKRMAYGDGIYAHCFFNPFRDTNSRGAMYVDLVRLLRLFEEYMTGSNREETPKPPVFTVELTIPNPRPRLTGRTTSPTPISPAAQPAIEHKGQKGGKSGASMEPAVQPCTNAASVAKKALVKRRSTRKKKPLRSGVLT